MRKKIHLPNSDTCIFLVPLYVPPPPGKHSGDGPNYEALLPNKNRIDPLALCFAYFVVSYRGNVWRSKRTLSILVYWMDWLTIFVFLKKHLGWNLLISAQNEQRSIQSTENFASVVTFRLTNMIRLFLPNNLLSSRMSNHFQFQNTIIICCSYFSTEDKPSMRTILHLLSNGDTAEQLQTTNPTIYFDIYFFILNITCFVCKLI